jgi:predicted RNA-binding protein YlxR (DUF448 family)
VRLALHRSELYDLSVIAHMRMEAVGSNGMTTNYQGLDNTHDDNRLVDMLGIGFRVFPSKARELVGRSLWLKGDMEEVWRLKGFRQNFLSPCLETDFFKQLVRRTKKATDVSNCLTFFRTPYGSATRT